MTKGYRLSLGYALFAGVFAVGFAFVFRSLASHGSSPSLSVTELLTNEFQFFGLATLSAFVGSRAAVLTGSSPCEWLAAFYTSVAYPLILVLPIIFWFGTAHTAKGAWILLIYVWFFVLMASFVGTILFGFWLDLIRMIHRQIGRHEERKMTPD